MVDRQFQWKLVIDMDVGKDALLAGMDDALTFDVVTNRLFVQVDCDRVWIASKDMQIDIGSFSNGTGPNAADELGMKWG